MRKILFGLFVIYNISFSAYDFPFKNRNVATIVGSSTLFIKGLPDDIPTEENSVTLPWVKSVDKQFWYNKGFKYSINFQPHKAPLIFIIAGTGSPYNSLRMKYLQRIFYNAGYHIVSISSPTNPNFQINASSSGMPGYLLEDSEDIYKVMLEIKKRLKGKEISNFFLTGYSLGATQAGVVGYIDKQRGNFNFERIFLINPAVDTYKSSLILDKFIAFEDKDRAIKIKNTYQHIIKKIILNANSPYTTLDKETIFKMFIEDKFTDEEGRHIIGLVFRLTSVDLNYIADVINKRGIYTEGEIGKFTPLFSSFERIDFATFNDYVNRLLFPYLKEKSGGTITFDEVVKKSSLKYISNYLKNSKNIAVVTNADELILDSEDIKYLKKTLKNQVLIYPTGGHCGNMFFPINVEVMLNFLKKGELPSEI